MTGRAKKILLAENWDNHYFATNNRLMQKISSDGISPFQPFTTKETAGENIPLGVKLGKSQFCRQ